MKASVLLNKNSLYRATELTMNTYQMAFLGNSQFKRSVRQKRPSEDSVIFDDLISNTSVMPLCRYVVDTINDVVFETGVSRDCQFVTSSGALLSPDSQEWCQLFQLDADLTNTSLDGVMETIGDMTSIYGFCWVFVDMPETQPGFESMVRPYVVPVSPLLVWDWSFTTVRGVQIPEFVKVLERETSDSYYFKCYYLGTKDSPSYWECYEVDKNESVENEIVPEVTGTFPLGMSIPGFIAYTKKDSRRFELGISDISIATDVQKEVYKLECEAYSSVQFARTLIRADAGVKVPAQAGSIVRATEGQIEAISVDQQDVHTIIAKQQDLLTNFQNLTGLGGLSTSSKQVQSGVSIIEERRQLFRMAKAKARLMEVAEENIFTFAARFMGVRWAGEVKYNTDFERSDTQYRLALLNNAKSLVADNPVINGIIVDSLIEMLVKPNEQAAVREAMIASVDQTTVMLERTDSQNVATRDIGDQVPDDSDEDSKEDMEDDATEGGGMGIIDTGASYSTENAIATQLVGMGMGIGR
jgi:hypothetical protein